MNFKDEIQKQIECNLKTYRDNSDKFISDYNHELELTKEYNGRQILELLQNDNDATSNEILIDWNKNNLKLTISNKGEPFLRSVFAVLCCCFWQTAHRSF